jgi:hypothetical protein
MQYLYLCIYLSRLGEDDASPIEHEIKRKIDRGDSSWLPAGRCLTLLDQEEDSAALEKTIHGLQESIGAIELNLRQTQKQTAEQGSVMQDVLDLLRKQRQTDTSV